MCLYETCKQKKRIKKLKLKNTAYFEKIDTEII